MANRMKEDEKNEKIIRGLLKLNPNKRCINCNSMGPQYVCINFWTFVCTTCSGIHREFTHRVKSVSMAKFTSQEVGCLQQGGNQKAKEIYFKEFDTQRHTLPDSSNVERLRDFIKHVYVERRYSGDRGGDKPPRGKMGDRDDTYENRRSDMYRSDSRSPPYDDQNADRRNSDRSSQGPRKFEYDRGRYDDKGYDDRRNSYEEKRSPSQYDSDRNKYDRGYQDNRRYDDTYKRSPSQFETGSDRRRFEDRRFPETPDRRRPEERSPNYQRDFSPPPVRPVRDILGDDVPTLRVSDFPRANGNRDAEGSMRSLPESRKEFRGQRTASSSSMGSIETNSPTMKRINSGSLIDFSAEPEPSSAAIQQDPFLVSSTKQPSSSVSQTSSTVQQDLFAGSSFKQQSTVSHQDPFAALSVSQTSSTVQQDLFGLSTISQPSTASASDNGGWATFEFGPQAGSAPNPTPAPTPASAPSALQSLTATPDPASQAHISGISALDTFGKANNAAQWTWASQQGQTSTAFASTANNLPAVMQSVQPSNGVAASQPWNSLLSSTTPIAPNSLQTVQQAQSAASLANLDAGSQQGHQSSGSTQNARKQIPEDLFAPLYSQPALHNTGFPMGSPFIGVSGPQFPSVAMPSYPGPVTYPPRPPSKSTNPFEVVGEAPAWQGNMFPSMGSVQAALPNYSPAPVPQHGSVLGTHNGQWTQQAPGPYPSAAVPGFFIGQHQAPKPVQSGAATPMSSFPSGSFPTDDIFSNFGGSQLSSKSSLSSIGSSNPFG